MSSDSAVDVPGFQFPAKMARRNSRCVRACVHACEIPSRRDVFETVDELCK